MTELDPVAIARESMARSFEDHGRPGDAAKVRAGEYISPLGDMMMRATVDGARAMQRAMLAAARDEVERMREALTEIANAYTAHGYADAMDAVQNLKDTAKGALK